MKKRSWWRAHEVKKKTIRIEERHSDSMRKGQGKKKKKKGVMVPWKTFSLC